MKTNIPYGRQHITNDDIDAVSQVLKSDFLTQGPVIADFEMAFAKYIGSNYAVAVSNGTAALHLCALALGVSSSQKVITTPITFAASANCIRYCNGEVVFSDIDRKTYLLDIDGVRQLLAKSPKGEFAGIVLVDFAGRAANLASWRKLADEYNLWIIEDACHAPGAYFMDVNGNSQKSGNGRYADLAVFSFHPVKHIAAGEGGMITTSNKALYEKLIELRTHGIVRQTDVFVNSIAEAAADQSATSYPGWYMEMQNLGYNYRLTDFQAALGLSQLKRAEPGLTRRKTIARVYSNAFRDHPNIVTLAEEAIESHALHLFVIEVDDRLGLYQYLRTHGILCQVHYVPLHLMPYYQSLGWRAGDMPNAEAYYSKCLSIPMYPSLSDEEVSFVIDKILSYYK